MTAKQTFQVNKIFFLFKIIAFSIWYVMSTRALKLYLPDTTISIGASLDKGNCLLHKLCIL